MTDFGQELRHRCRNPRCRMKLPGPVSNLREAFCTRGCYNSFYLKRCHVCDKPIEQPNRGGTRLICKKSKCKNAWKSGLGFGRFAESGHAASYGAHQPHIAQCSDWHIANVSRPNNEVDTWQGVPVMSAAIALLAELAPACITPAQPKPLAIGIERDLIRLAGAAIEPHELIAALKRYTTSEAYLQALRPGAQRIGVDGRPAEIVSAGAAAVAAEAYANRLLARDRRRPLAPRTAPKPVPGRMLKSFDELGRYLGRKKRQV